MHPIQSRLSTMEEGSSPPPDQESTMPHFSTAPVDEVVPQRQTKGPSPRSVLQQEYREALQNALDAGEALVIELELDDKGLTIRNRVKKASEALGHGDLTIRRKGNRVLAYPRIAHESG